MRRNTKKDVCIIKKHSSDNSFYNSSSGPSVNDEPTDDEVTVTSFTRVSPIIGPMQPFFYVLSIYSNKYVDGCTKVAMA